MKNKNYYAMVSIQFGVKDMRPMIVSKMVTDFSSKLSKFSRRLLLDENDLKVSCPKSPN